MRRSIAVKADGRYRIHALVLDALGMSDIDYTGTQALRTMLDELERKQIAFGVARAGQLPCPSGTGPGPGLDARPDT